MFLALHIILTEKQRFGECNFIECNSIKCNSVEYINGRNETNIKNRTYYFYNDQIDLKDFDAKLLKIDKKDYNEIDIYYIGYVTIKKMVIIIILIVYLITNEMIGHFEEKNQNKYLVLDEIDQKKEVLNKYKKVWEGIKKEIETINSGEKIEYRKDF